MSDKISRKYYQAFVATLLWLLPVQFISTALAQQCFSDASKAYDHLLAQEKRQQINQQAAIDHAWVNINTASEGELASLDGIGSSKAQAIILYRESFGSFESVEDLTRVKGIGEATLEKNRQRLRVR